MKVIGYLVTFGVGLFEMGYRLAHPDLTETQLFLRTLPAIPVLILGLAVLFAAGVHDAERKRRGEA